MHIPTLSGIFVVIFKKYFYYVYSRVIIFEITATLALGTWAFADIDIVVVVKSMPYLSLHIIQYHTIIIQNASKFCWKGKTKIRNKWAFILTATITFYPEKCMT